MRVTMELDDVSAAAVEGLITLSGARRGAGPAVLFLDAAAARRLGDRIPPADRVILFLRPGTDGYSDGYPGGDSDEYPDGFPAAAAEGRGAEGDVIRVPLPYSVPDMTALLARLDRGEETPVLAEPIPKPAAEAVQIVPADRVVRRGAAEVRLTPREFALFSVLLEARGAPVTREALLAAVWHREASEHSNVVDVYARYLRHKLAPVFGETAVRSARGKGYALRLGE